MKFAESTISSAGLLAGTMPGATTPLGQLLFPSLQTKSYKGHAS